MTADAVRGEDPGREAMSALRELLARRASLHPALLEGAAFEATVRRRAAIAAAGDLDGYRRLAEACPEREGEAPAPNAAAASAPMALAKGAPGLGPMPELERLVAEIAVPETWFFRYPRAFELLIDHLRAVRHRAAGQPLRLLSVGCATGAEPCSMAMASLHAGLADAGGAPACSIEIEALDRSPVAIHVAQGGVYPASALRAEAPTWAAAYLHRRDDGSVAVAPEVRALVQYRCADALAQRWPAGAYEAIFCRNVLVYLDADARARLTAQLATALVDGGLLLLGHADPAERLPGLTPMRVAHAFAWRRETTPVAPQAPTVERAGREAESRHAGHGSQGSSAWRVRDEREAPPRSSSTPAAPPAPAMSETAAAPTLAAAAELADAGRTAEAEAMVRAFVARHGASAKACELQATLALARDDLDAAERLLKQAVYFEPRRASALLQLALLSRRLGRDGEAAAWRERARRAEAARKGSA